MDLNLLTKVSFRDEFQYLRTHNTLPSPKDDEEIIESNISLDDLIILMSKVEDTLGIGRLIHKEAYEGIDYLGNPVNFNSYICWTRNPKDKEYAPWATYHPCIIYKYNFDDYIPLNSYIKRKNRNEIIDKLL